MLQNFSHKFFTADEEAKPDVPRSATSNEVDTISNVLSFVLKSLLDDVDVHTAIRNLSNEPIPYFAQITRTEVNVQSDYNAVFCSALSLFESQIRYPEF